MKKLVLLPVSAGLLILAFGFAFGQVAKKAGSKQAPRVSVESLVPPPASLDALYPPKAEQPVYQLAMMGMDMSFGGIVVDLMENDTQNVKANFAQFKQQYVQTSKMVPEWTAEFPLQPVEELGVALEGGDQGKVMAAYEKVGKVCHDCHIVNMPKVQQKYHWQDFDGIMATDPITREDLTFARLMQYLDVSLSGIFVNLSEGQTENARKQFQAFDARFKMMKDVCEACHNTERKYYVDQDVQNLVDQLGQALNSPKVDPKAVENLAMAIGTESCQKCHLVHVPAAAAKAQWALPKVTKGR